MASRAQAGFHRYMMEPPQTRSTTTGEACLTRRLVRSERLGDGRLCAKPSCNVP